MGSCMPKPITNARKSTCSIFMILTNDTTAWPARSSNTIYNECIYVGAHRGQEDLSPVTREITKATPPLPQDLYVLAFCLARFYILCLSFYIHAFLHTPTASSCIALLGMLLCVVVLVGLQVVAASAVIQPKPPPLQRLKQNLMIARVFGCPIS